MTNENFGKMVNQYEKLVYTICYQFTRNHHTAQDLAQETFLSAYSHIDTCPAGNEKPWLARIATNKAKDFLKSAYNRHVSAMDNDTMPEDGGALFLKQILPADVADSKESVQNIADEIEALKEPYHNVAVMYFLQEKSVEEISEMLQRPPKTVHTQLYRARILLKKKWERGEDNAAVS